MAWAAFAAGNRHAALKSLEAKKALDQDRAKHNDGCTGDNRVPVTAWDFGAGGEVHVADLCTGCGAAIYDLGYLNPGKPPESRPPRVEVRSVTRPQDLVKDRLNQGFGEVRFPIPPEPELREAWLRAVADPGSELHRQMIQARLAQGIPPSALGSQEFHVRRRAEPPMVDESFRHPSWERGIVPAPGDEDLAERSDDPALGSPPGQEQSVTRFLGHAEQRREGPDHSPGV
jgi:hypothetical protein